jgi:hypothetical protein
MYREWRESPHAHAGSSALYRALQKPGGESCQRCHEPLRTLGAAPELARTDGVSCETCHRIEGVTVYADHADAPLVTAHGTKYGPRCDAKRPYFHKVECRALFDESDLCAACHLLAVPGSKGQWLQTQSAYSDWLKGPAPAEGKTCQTCHMLPGVESPLAVGQLKRSGVPDHGFWGRESSLRNTALSANARASWRGESLILQVQVSNDRAGHPVPAGAPGHQFVLRVTSIDERGEEISRQERVFERRLIDATGATANCSNAQDMARDTRIAPRESRQERFEWNGLETRRIRVALLRRTDPQLVQQLAISARPEERILETTFGVGSQGATRWVRPGSSALVR